MEKHQNAGTKSAFTPINYYALLNTFFFLIK